MSFIKICGLTRIEDAQFAAECGADVLGIVREHKSARYVAPDHDLLSWEAPIPCVNVFLDFLGEVIPDAHWVQLEHGTPPTRHRVLQVVRFKPGTTIDEAMQRIDSLDSSLDKILIDTFHPTMGGGTGKTSDWGLAAEIVRRTSRKVILAGGLKPENVQEAIVQVQPWGVDVSSGVEMASGVKDAAKVREFVQRAREAFRRLAPDKQ